MVKLVFHP